MEKAWKGKCGNSSWGDGVRSHCPLEASWGTIWGGGVGAVASHWCLIPATLR